MKTKSSSAQKASYRVPVTETVTLVSSQAILEASNANPYMPDMPVNPVIPGEF